MKNIAAMIEHLLS